MGIWGEDPMYLRGVYRNIEERKNYFSDWNIILMVDSNVSDEWKDLYSKQDIKMVVADRVRYTSRFGGLFVDDFDYAIVRDCDSRLTHRELLMVDEWIESGSDFHIIRDHPNHKNFILAGMFGIKNGPVLDMFKDQYMKNASRYNDFVYGDDEKFLGECIWPNIITNHYAHDEHNKYTGFEKRYPISITGHMFVGNKFDADDVALFDVEKYIGDHK